MYLTPEEERIYDGEMGWAHQVSMKILIRLGELFGATQLIPISSAHISGVSYKTIGEAPISFLETLVDSRGRVKVFSTINPSLFDLRYVDEMAIPPEAKEKQKRIIYLYKSMGIIPALTCTPYYLKRPKPGSNLAWAESSAVIYANSILGSWTNREGGPSALAAALIGKTPNYGVHQPENREPNILIQVETKLQNEHEFGALGIYVGRLIEDKVPIFSGVNKCTKTDLKQLGAALASSGMASIFHLTSEEKESRSIEKITVEDKDLKESVQGLSTTSNPPDLVFLGCPHCSLSEIRQISEEIKGKKVKKDVKLWICTSRYIKDMAKGYVDIIESAGGKVLCDTCAIVTWLDRLGVDTLMTNSAKTAYYAPTLNRVKTAFASMKHCINAACEG